jgi:class 3 adenylate cyclase
MTRDPKPGDANEGPGLGEWLESTGGVVGIVLTDLVGSTLLLYRLKTRNYEFIRRAHHDRAAALAAQSGGWLVEKEKDEVLAVFRSATSAYQFAAELFRDAGHPRLSVRAGVHYGAVTPSGAGVIGRSVHLAARITEYGRAHEVWVSDAAKDALERESSAFAAGIPWIASEVCQLKGIPGPQRLWRAA